MVKVDVAKKEELEEMVAFIFKMMGGRPMQKLPTSHLHRALQSIAEGCDVKVVGSGNQIANFQRKASCLSRRAASSSEEDEEEDELTEEWRVTYTSLGSCPMFGGKPLYRNTKRQLVSMLQSMTEDSPVKIVGGVAHAAHTHGDVTAAFKNKCSRLLRLSHSTAPVRRKRSKGNVPAKKAKQARGKGVSTPRLPSQRLFSVAKTRARTFPSRRIGRRPLHRVRKPHLLRMLQSIAEGSEVTTLRSGCPSTTFQRTLCRLSRPAVDHLAGLIKEEEQKEEWLLDYQFRETYTNRKRQMLRMLHCMADTFPVKVVGGGTHANSIHGDATAIFKKKCSRLIRLSQSTAPIMRSEERKELAMETEPARAEVAPPEKEEVVPVPLEVRVLVKGEELVEEKMEAPAEVHKESPMEEEMENVEEVEAPKTEKKKRFSKIRNFFKVVGRKLGKKSSGSGPAPSPAE